MALNGNMVTVTTQFTIVANTVSQSDATPNVGDNAGGAGFQYPSYVPVSVPSAVPSKEARITNVSMPSIVLPGATFNIVCTFQTFITQQMNYVVHLTIPQLNLDHSSSPTALANLSRGSVILTVSLPLGEAGEASGIITGQIDLLNTTSNTTDDGTPISFRIQNPGDQTEGPDHHIGTPPSILPPIIGQDTDQSGGTVVILANPPTGDTGGNLDLDVHGFQPNEDIDLDLGIPMLGKDFPIALKADILGHFTHTFNISKPSGKQYVASIKATGRQSKKSHSKTINF